MLGYEPRDKNFFRKKRLETAIKLTETKFKELIELTVTVKVRRASTLTPENPIDLENEAVNVVEI